LKSVKAEVYFKTCLGKNGKSCEIFGKTKDSYCSIFCHLIHYLFLNHFKPAIRVHSVCVCVCVCVCVLEDFICSNDVLKESKNH
jgi:hypothetical protein